METRFNIGDKARINVDSIEVNGKGKIVTIADIKVEKTNITLDGVKLDTVEIVAFDAFGERKWYYADCFDGPITDVPMEGEK
jgi:hypothetical protein